MIFDALFVFVLVFMMLSNDGPNLVPMGFIFLKFFFCFIEFFSV